MKSRGHQRRHTQGKTHQGTCCSPGSGQERRHMTIEGQLCARKIIVRPHTLFRPRSESVDSPSSWSPLNYQYGGQTPGMRIHKKHSGHTDPAITTIWRYIRNITSTSFQTLVVCCKDFLRCSVLPFTWTVLYTCHGRHTVAQYVPAVVVGG